MDSSVRGSLSPPCERGSVAILDCFSSASEKNAHAAWDGDQVRCPVTLIVFPSVSHRLVGERQPRLLRASGLPVRGDQPYSKRWASVRECHLTALGNCVAAAW